FSSRRRHTRFSRDWSSDVCSSDLTIEETVKEIISEVYLKKDEALKAFSEKFDGIIPDKLVLEKDEIEALAFNVPRDRMRAIEIAFSNIHRFHNIQMKKERKVETMPGVTCW